jgi:hypothetical protein
LTNIIVMQDVLIQDWKNKTDGVLMCINFIPSGVSSPHFITINLELKVFDIVSCLDYVEWYLDS